MRDANGEWRREPALETLKAVSPGGRHGSGVPRVRVRLESLWMQGESYGFRRIEGNWCRVQSEKGCCALERDCMICMTAWEALATKPYTLRGQDFSFTQCLRNSLTLKAID